MSPARAGLALLAVLALAACGRDEEEDTASLEGSVCGIPGVIGDEIDPIPGRVAGCGVAAPVFVTEVAGVALSQGSIMDCPTARALDTWVRDGAIPAVGSRGGGLAELGVVAHYVCRTRNHRPGGRISEHGKGKAIDIAAVTLRSGEKLELLDGWTQPGESRIWRQMHGAACGPFGTVLGPESDRFHLDHFHFDTASYRSGPYCR